MTEPPEKLPFVRPDVRAFLDGFRMFEDFSLEQLITSGQRDLLKRPSPLTGQPTPLAVTRDGQFDGPAGPLRYRLFDVQETRLPGPAVVFLHGGGFCVGDLDSHAGMCADLALGLNLPVVSIEYRLAPEHPFPAAPDDVEAAARWIAGSPAELGLKVTALVLAGDSAGGNLAIVAAVALRDRPAAVPAIAQAVFYPVLGRQQGNASYQQFCEGYFLTRKDMEFFDRAYAADTADWRGKLAELDVSGLPPALVVTASLDPLRDEGRAYAARLARAGVPVTFREAVGTIHGFMTFRAMIPSAAGDIASALTALKPLVDEAEAARVMAQAAGA